MLCVCDCVLKPKCPPLVLAVSLNDRSGQLFYFTPGIQPQPLATTVYIHHVVKGMPVVTIGHQSPS